MSLSGDRGPYRPSYPQVLATIGDHLRKRRLELGLLQWEVAERLHVNPGTVSNWGTESNETRPNLRARLIDLIGSDPSPVSGLAQQPPQGCPAPGRPPPGAVRTPAGRRPKHAQSLGMHSPGSDRHVYRPGQDLFGAARGARSARPRPFNWPAVGRCHSPGGLVTELAPALSAGGISTRVRG
jgi:hypothetical protein